MIAAFMLYSMLLAALAAAAAWLVESALAAWGRPRRQAWIAGLVISVLLPMGMLLVPRAQPVTLIDVTNAAPATASSPVLSTYVVSAATEARFAGARLESLALGGWVIASSVLLGFYGLSMARLARQSRRWPESRVGANWVTIAPDVGPAVFGWWQPRVVFPRWLLSAPSSTQQIALAHEREHLAVRDPQVLTVATLLFALFPWNAPLLWMLRRLRFAMEVDCDARVVRGGIDPAFYGEALLYVSQRQASAPATSIALIERPSQLERRINIMFASPRKNPVLVAAASLLLAASCLYAATNVDAPARAGVAGLLKPPPGPTKLGVVFEQLLQTKFPGLLAEKVTGTAVLVVLMNEDWSVARAEKIISPGPMETFENTKAIFSVLGLDEESVPYIGNMGMQSPHDPNNRVLVAFTERATPGQRFVSKLAPDTRDVDRAIFERHFPAAAKDGVPSGEKVWVLLDRDGKVLRSGQEPIAEDQWIRTLESHFSGIKTQEVTVTPIVDVAGNPRKDRAGKDLQLHCVWLAPDSPLPAKT